jgi:hypothetical protein
VQDKLSKDEFVGAKAQGQQESASSQAVTGEHSGADTREVVRSERAARPLKHPEDSLVSHLNLEPQTLLPKPLKYPKTVWSHTRNEKMSNDYEQDINFFTIFNYFMTVFLRATGSESLGKGQRTKTKLTTN